VTMDMLVSDLLNTTRIASAAGNDDAFKYSKDILLDISTKGSDTALPLDHAHCWPCITPSGQEFRAIGSFYVNDRQDLFNIFTDLQPFLDFDFNTSKAVSNLLRSRGCVSFISKQVIVQTDPRPPLQFDNDLTLSYQKRADSLNRYAI
jgi:hypothetical protein